MVLVPGAASSNHLSGVSNGIGSSIILKDKDAHIYLDDPAYETCQPTSQPIEIAIY